MPGGEIYFICYHENQLSFNIIPGGTLFKKENQLFFSFWTTKKLDKAYLKLSIQINPT